MREMQLKTEINDEERDEENEIFINEEDNSNEIIEEKVNTFKLKIIRQFNYFNNHYILNTFIKLIFGIFIIALPFICIIIFEQIDFSKKDNFMFFPYFITLCIILGSLTILLVIKLGESCQIYGIIIYTWERKNLFQITNTIFIGLLLLWFLFACEKFIKSYNLLKERVAQTISKESSTKLFNKGSYTLRILFILFFWDTEKDKNGDYIHELLEYFDYEENVLSEFNDDFRSLIVPIILISFYNLLRLIFFKYKKQILYFSLNLLILFQSFFLAFYPIDQTYTDVFKENYFSNIACKYLELLVYIAIIFLFMYISFKEYISNLIRKKYFPRKAKIKYKKIIILIVVSSFIINIIGYIFLIILFFMLTFDEIDEKLKIERFHLYWIFIYLSLSLILLGYSFILGHFCFGLIYYPIFYEITPHNLKNEFYTKCSGRFIKSEENPRIKYSKRSFDLYFP